MGHRGANDSRRPVIVLGATGAVGQRFVHRLADHPWFRIAALAASSRSAGRTYAEACRWVLAEEMPESVRQMPVLPLDPAVTGLGDDSMPIVFSALPSGVAHDVEPDFARKGCGVFSNASAFRYEDDVPLLIPEVNLNHAGLLQQQRARREWPGFIVTNPNCTTSGIAMILKPLQEAFGLHTVMATTMQAVSGAGYPGVPTLDSLDNVLPLIPTEEEKIERETRLLLGSLAEGHIQEAGIEVSAHANRVPVLDGHTVCLSLGFEDRPTPEAAIGALKAFQGAEASQGLPSSPSHPIHVLEQSDRPQPRLDRDRDLGMAVSVGRIRRCPVLALRMVLVVHNTIRGAAGGSILNAEALLAQGALG